MRKYFCDVDTFVEKNLNVWLEELRVLCSQPSVSAQDIGMGECAELVSSFLEKRGFDAEICRTPRYPIVCGELHGANSKTLLFYNHYDVQPPEPLELWDSPPFEPTIRDGALYARGATDDKGHIICRLAALDAVLATAGVLPCTIKICIDGEEEIGSPSLPGFVADNLDRLSADACIWEAGGVDHRGSPVHYCGLRGICYVELRVRTADYDAHSGIGGSVFPNAAWRLTWALACLKDNNERIRISGFYDHVKPPTKRDLELLESLPDTAECMREQYGLKGFLKGLRGGTDFRREAIFEPTCTICGIRSGYQNTGVKTVLPAEASAKIDFRLVPDQTPEEVLSLLREHLDAEGFPDVEVHSLGSNQKPGRTDPDHPFVDTVLKAARDVYQLPPTLTPMIGGSGPYYAFADTLGMPIGVTGVSYPGGKGHAPNEHVRLENFVNGVRHTARAIVYFANGYK